MITLQYDLVKFDITGVLGFEINQHIDFYNAGVDEAYMPIKNKDETTALSLLRVLKSQLDSEYKYFDSKRFWNFNSLNDAYSYVDGINRASRSLVGAPNYKNMNSMLYNIQDYMTRHKYEEDKLYGNVFVLAVDKRLDEMTNQEYHSNAGKLLQSIRSFYLRPGKGTTKDCIRLSKEFSPKRLEHYIYKDYFSKYLR